MSTDFTFADSIDIAATPAEVYAAVSDITRIGEWSPICVGGVWDEGDAPSGDAGPRVGARFTGHNAKDGGEWQTHCEVVAAETGRSFAWLVNDGLVAWSYTLEPDGPGSGTRLTESWEFRPAGLAFFREAYGESAEKQIAIRTEDARTGIPLTLAAIKRVVEAA